MDLLLKMRQMVNESTIDYPRQGLAPDVWGADKKLLPEVKQSILDHIATYKPLDLKSLAQKIEVVGSIGTNQYSDDADIDVHLVIDKADLPGDKTAEEYQKEAKKFFDESNRLFVGKHPVEVYMQYDPNQELGYASAIYDLLSDTWERGPQIMDADYDPYEHFSHVFEVVREEVEKADVTLGELFRDVEDYKTMDFALESLPSDAKQKIAQSMSEKLQEITEDIETLAAYRQEWKEARQDASSAPAEKAQKNPKVKKHWEDENAKFKFIQRYGYMDLIVKLEKMIKDDKQVSANEVDKIADIIK